MQLTDTPQFLPCNLDQASTSMQQLREIMAKKDRDRGQSPRKDNTVSDNFYPVNRVTEVEAKVGSIKSTTEGRKMTVL